MAVENPKQEAELNSNEEPEGLGLLFKAVAIGAFLLVVGLWVSNLVLGMKGVLDADGMRAGEFGDMFGAVNSLFSGLAFAGIILAIFLQQQELKLQRKELKQTRAELRGQKEQLAAQVVHLEQKAFDDRFFQLMMLQQETVVSTMLTVRGVESRGRSAFKILHHRLENYAERNVLDIDAQYNDEWRTTVLEPWYMNFYRSEEHHLGHYFRSLYHLFKYVDQSRVDDKRKYTALIRAQLSHPELVLLFYNCLTLGYTKFKPLAERYELFQNLPVDRLPHRNLVSAYTHAFGSESTSE